MTVFGKTQVESILQRQLGEDLVVEDCRISPNTKAGENYGSVMLALNITLCRKRDSPVETLHLIAKLPPPTEILQAVFDFKITFCKEMNIYKLIVPEFEKLQKDHGFSQEDLWDNTAKYYGAQTSAVGDKDAYADLDAALLLENLKIRDFRTGDRLAGLDLTHAQLALVKLAQFHALPIVLRKKRPQVYEKTVLKTACPFTLGGGLGDPVTNIDKFLVELKQNIPEIKPFVERLKKQCLDNCKHGNDSLSKEPFATIVHNDLWTNNMMFAYNVNSSPIDIKFVDFQTTIHCSPVKDLVFFLFTSLEDAVFRDHYDHLVNLYYTNLINMLKRFDCDTSPFSLPNFLNEINDFAPTQLHHILFMQNVINMERSDVKELSEIDESHEFKVASSNMCKHRMLRTIKEFDKRGWLRNLE